MNEGFASWVEVLGLNHANPEFKALDIFVIGIIVVTHSEDREHKRYVFKPETGQVQVLMKEPLEMLNRDYIHFQDEKV